MSAEFIQALEEVAGTALLIGLTVVFCVLLDVLCKQID